MPHPVFDDWISCLGAFDSLSSQDRELVFEEVGSEHFREELLIWGTQEVLPDESLREKPSEAEKLRESVTKRNLTDILEALQNLKNGHRDNKLRSLVKEGLGASGLGLGKDRAVTGDLSRAAVIHQRADDANLRNKRKPPPVDESSSDSESSDDSNPPGAASSRGTIASALERLLKLALLSAGSVLPKENECPEFFKTPGFPFQSKPASRRGQLTGVGEAHSGSARYSLRKNSFVSGQERKRTPNPRFVCVFPRCPQPYQLYQDAKEFLTHLNDTHCDDKIEVHKKSWICYAVVHENDMPYYESQEELREHLKAEHKDVTDGRALENLISLSARDRTPVHPASWCTICYAPIPAVHESLPKSDAGSMQGFLEHLRNHIAEVLREAMEGVKSLKENKTLLEDLGRRRPLPREKETGAKEKETGVAMGLRNDPSSAETAPLLEPAVETLGSPNDNNNKVASNNGTFADPRNGGSPDAADIENGSQHVEVAVNGNGNGSSPKPTVKMAALLPALAIGIFLVALDQTLTIATYGKIGSDLQALNSTSWIATSYFLTLTTFQPLYGKLSDIFGRKTCLLFAYAVFGLGCLGCGLARDILELCIARAVAGAGGGGMNAVVTILVTDLVSLRDRGVWQGYINIVFAAGPSLSNAQSRS
ncbi:hypothetical protein O1611_g7040 [Lasiodiplodia mahajangana]|uniref:Uncharacterized protein n=1 Tax=Lasiodiplodia mahajangana TaxID=1108764 RepID=A0ACC2JH81_9PEZI|nr:hypothetical protein O1611_g7040 [Lasiodiplodia mahajangana]